MTAIGVVGWTVDEVLLGRETSWLGWYTVFALFGAVAPLLALLAQPHRGAREPITASIAVDMAGIAVMTGFLYSHFAVGADLAPLTSREASVPLLLLHEFQQILRVRGLHDRGAGGPRPAVGGDIPPPRARADRRPRDPDHQQPGNPAGPVLNPAACTI